MNCKVVSEGKTPIYRDSKETLFSASLITIIIPTLNEAATIGDIIERCRVYGNTILVVDGHSHDSTVEIASSMNAAVLYDDGLGKGNALRKSVRFITTPIAVFIDADGSHDPSNIPDLIKPIIDNQADHVVGSRLLGGSSELHGSFDKCFRLMGSAFITACINHRFKAHLSDSQNGFRAIRTSVLHSLDLTEDTTTIEQEMTIKTLKRGFRLVEVPAHEHNRISGDSRIQLKKVAFRYIYSMIKHLYF